MLETPVPQVAVHEGFGTAGEVVRAASSQTAEIEAIGLAIKLLLASRSAIKGFIRKVGGHRGPPAEITIYNDSQEAVSHWKTHEKTNLVVWWPTEYDVQWISRTDRWFSRYAHRGSRYMCPPGNFLRVGDGARGLPLQYDALPSASSAPESNGQHAHRDHGKVKPAPNTCESNFSLEDMD